MTTERTPNNEQTTLLAFSDVIPSTTPEESPHDLEPETESPKCLQETLNENPSLTLENFIKMLSENFTSRTFSETMEPTFKAFGTIFSKIPPIHLILYLLLIFTWNHLQRSHLILLVLGCLLGYMLQNNSAASSRPKNFLYQEPYIQQNIESSLQAIKSAEKVTSTELSITPQVDEALNKTFDFILRDFVNSFYDPINPNKNPEFSNQVRNAMNIMSMNLALCLQNIDKVEVGIMSSFAIANTFIIHLFIATNKSLEVYCAQNPSSPFVHTINKESQVQTLRCLSKLILMRLLPSDEIKSHVLMALLTELWTTQVLGTALEMLCDPDWLNLSIVEYLTDKDDETHDTTLLQQLATSIDEEVSGLSEQLNQPSSDIKVPVLSVQSLTSSPISYQSNLPLETFKEQTNSLVESLTEISSGATIQSSSDSKLPVLNVQSIKSSPISYQSNSSLDASIETFKEQKNSLVESLTEIPSSITIQSSSDSQASVLNVQSITSSSPISYQSNLPLETFKEQTNSLVESLTEISSGATIQSSSDSKLPVLNVQSIKSSPISYQSNSSLDASIETFKEQKNSLVESLTEIPSSITIQSSSDSQASVLNVQSITSSSPISYQLNSPLNANIETFEEQNNSLVESLTEIPSSATIQSSANDKEPILNDQSLTSSPQSSQTNLLESNPETFEEPKSSIEVPMETLPDVTIEDFTDSPNFSPSRPFMRSVNSDKLRIILERQNEVFVEFMAFLEEREAANLLRFWLQVDSFRKIASDEPNINLVQEDALKIFNVYFGESATYPVKISNDIIINQCTREIFNAPTCNCYVTLQEYVFGVLESEYFDDFLMVMKNQGEDINFMFVEESKQIAQSRNNSSSASEISIEGKFFKRHNTTGNLSPISNNSEYLDYSSSYDKQSNGLLTSATYRSRSYSAGSLVDALNNFTSSFTKRNSYASTDEMTDSDSESPPIIPKIDLSGVRIRLTDVSESSPNKYIYSTKSLSYMIEVERPGSTGWIITRNFSDFEKMHSALTKDFPKAEKVSMPRLMLKKSQAACKSLERYLNILLSDLALCESEPLQKFMRRDGVQNEGLVKSVGKNGIANSAISVPKSVSMVNIVNSSAQDTINDKVITPQFGSEESLSPKRYSSSSFQEHLNISPNILTEVIQEISEEISNNDTPTQMFSNVVSPSVESTISTSWDSSKTVVTTSSNENDTSIIINNNKEPDLKGLNIHCNITTSNSLKSTKIPLIGPPPTPKKRTRPNKQVTSHNADLLIDTMFAIIEEIFDLSDKSQWHIRKTVLSVLRGVVRKSYTEAIKQSYLLTIDSLFTEEYAMSIIDNLNNSLWPDGILADLTQQRSEEEKLRTKEEVKRLLLQKAIPDSLKQVMGNDNSKIMIGRLVDGFLAEKEVLRGMGINILESVVKLIIND
ncbi:5475_t:CDS:2 [Cetraspora pellucida]|uniref:5475_t:CDS:1 n=1 Tax=Cetraspora pellucida TaxID=1433469 RepID=A0A9N9B3X1_9GLOM|nr:5475_t:CDS:2 [Cetraspora pellucida]